MVKFRLELKKLLIDALFILLAVLAASFGLKGFLLPSKFLDGGATGISLLLTELTILPLSTLLILVNIPFILFGFSFIGRGFGIKTLIAILLLALAVAIVPYPIITADKLLISVFGGFFLGLGIGMAVRGGAVIDGTEVLAIAISRKTNLTIGDVVLLVNVMIFSTAAWLLSVETALYAILTYLAASKTVDFVIEGIEEYTGVTIVSLKSDKMAEMINHKMGRGFTIYHGERGYGRSGEKYYNNEMRIVYTIITRLEVSRLKLEIEKIDPNAFVFMTSIKDMKGGMIKKRRMNN